jgi:hypothetical protein
MMNNKPIKRIKVCGSEITAWKGKFGIVYKFARSYKGKDGQWKSTEWFNYRDLMSLRVAIDRVLAQPEEEERAESAQSSQKQINVSVPEGYSEEFDEEYPY